MNFRQHVQSDRAKWAVVTVAILALAVLITGLMTSWFKDFNPYCWFGHTYDEETHVCTKCGAEEPAETDKALQEDGALASMMADLDSFISAQEAQEGVTTA